jgi:hypothetical protein
MAEFRHSRRNFAIHRRICTYTATEFGIFSEECNIFSHICPTFSRRFLGETPSAFRNSTPQFRSGNRRLHTHRVKNRTIVYGYG